MQSFAPVATIGVILLLSGAITLSLRSLPSITEIPSTAWGRWWLLKVGLATFMMGLGAWNWRRLRAPADVPQAPSRAPQGVSRSARAELLLGLAAVIATAFLTSIAQPGMEP